MKTLAFLLYLVVLASACSAAVSYGSWHSCWIGGGGYIQNVVLCPSKPTRLYAYVDVGGIFRSDDAGRNWRMIHGSMPTGAGYNVRSLLVNPRNADKIIAATGNGWGSLQGIWTSDDGGASWSQRLHAEYQGNGDYRWAGVVLARDPHNPNILLTASVNDGVYRSTDDGRSWTLCGAKGLYPTDIKYDRFHPNRVWLCTQNKGQWKGEFLESEDGGLTWNKASQTSPEEILQDPKSPTTLYGIVSGSVWKSLDSGKTWSLFNDGLPTGNDSSVGDSESEFESLAAGSNFILTASTKGTFYRLPCGTDKWIKIERQGIVSIYEGEPWFRANQGSFGWALASIIIDPRNENHWYFTDWFSIYQTFDAGKNWSLCINGIEVTVIHCLQQDPSNPNIIHLGMADNGYFRSVNEGDSFTNVDWKGGISNNIKCISLSPKNPDMLYAVGPKQWDWVANQVFISTNGGVKWTRSPMTGLPDMTEHHCNSIAVDPRNPERVYLAVSQDVKPGGGGVYRSLDGGMTWKWIGDGLPEGKPFFTNDIWVIGRELAVGADGEVMAMSGDQKCVYRWNPKSQMWRRTAFPASSQPNCIVADPKNPGTFFVAADGVMRTRDNGATWRHVWSGYSLYVAVDMNNSNRVAAGMSDGVILSEDGGNTWKALDKSLPYRANPIPAFCGDRLIVGTAGNGAFWINIH